MKPEYGVAVFALCLTFGPLFAAEDAGQPGLEFYGYAHKSDGTPERAFLRRGGAIFIAAEGDLIEDTYRLVRIAADSAVVEDVSNTQRQTLPLAAPKPRNDSAAAQPAPSSARAAKTGRPVK